MIFLVDPSGPSVLLAGGIGVAPLILMAAALDKAGQEIAFHFTGRSADVMAYRDALSARWGDKFHLHCDDADTRLDLGGLIASLAHVARWTPPASRPRPRASPRHGCILNCLRPQAPRG